jgi:hypothetical protein
VVGGARARKLRPVTTTTQKSCPTRRAAGEGCGHRVMGRGQGQLRVPRRTCRTWWRSWTPSWSRLTASTSRTGGMRGVRSRNPSCQNWTLRTVRVWLVAWWEGKRRLIKQERERAVTHSKTKRRPGIELWNTCRQTLAPNTFPPLPPPHHRRPPAPRWCDAGRNTFHQTHPTSQRTS